MGSRGARREFIGDVRSGRHRPPRVHRAARAGHGPRPHSPTPGRRPVRRSRGHRDFLARAAAGRATTVGAALLANVAPVAGSAMNDRMWAHPQTASNARQPPHARLPRARSADGPGGGGGERPGRCPSARDRGERGRFCSRRPSAGCGCWSRRAHQEAVDPCGICRTTARGRWACDRGRGLGARRRRHPSSTGDDGPGAGGVRAVPVTPTARCATRCRPRLGPRKSW